MSAYLACVVCERSAHLPHLSIVKFHAGVSDQEQAQTVVDFASSVELLKKQEVQKLRLAELNLADTDSIQSVLPRYRSLRMIYSISSAISTSSGYCLLVTAEQFKI